MILGVWAKNLRPLASQEIPVCGLGKSAVKRRWSEAAKNARLLGDNQLQVVRGFGVGRLGITEDRIIGINRVQHRLGQTRTT